MTSHTYNDCIKPIADQEWKVVNFNNRQKIKQKKIEQTLEKGKFHTPNRDKTTAPQASNEGINVKIFNADTNKYLNYQAYKYIAKNKYQTLPPNTQYKTTPNQY